MTALREKAINMVSDIAEEQIPRIILFVETIQKNEDGDLMKTDKDSRQAYQNLQKYRRRGAAQPDYKKEIASAIEEKYESIG